MTDCGYEEPCPEDAIVEDTTPVVLKPEVPLLMMAWFAVPVIDFAAGMFNAATYIDSSYSDDFRLLTYSEIASGVVGIVAWFAGAIQESHLSLLKYYSFIVPFWEMGALYLTWYSFENVVEDSDYDN